MRDRDATLHVCGCSVREVRNVLANLAGLKCRCHSFVINKEVTSEVEDDHAVLHKRYLLRIDHLLGVLIGIGIVDKRCMYRNEIGVLVNFVTSSNDLDLRAELSLCCVGEERIATDNLHAESKCCVSERSADSTETDDTERLAKDLCSCELRLVLLNRLVDSFVSLVVLNPADTAYDITGCKKHSCDSELLNCIGIGTGCIENDDAFVSCAVKRDVVNACAGTCDSLKALREFHLMHRCASDKSNVCIVKILNYCIVGCKMSHTDLRDLI